MKNNLTSFKKSLVLFFNAYGLKEYYMLLKYYKLSPSGPDKEPMLISMVDSRRQGKGLTDRFKGIVSVYALSKAENVPYRCIYNHPCQLTDFFEPNLYNWIPREGELSESVRDVRLKLLRKQRTVKRLLKVLPVKKQLRVYANLDYLDEINRVYHTGYDWGTLFKELFKPTPALESQMRIHQANMGAAGYNACVFRFQALLGDFKEYHFKPLPEPGRRQLIETNKKALTQLVRNSDLPVLVTSDSTTFLSEIKDLDNVYTIPGKVVHIDNVDDAGKEVYMKSFLDFMMLSRARRVYAMGTRIMYQTDFPRFAAKINDIPFERIIIG